MHVPFEETLKNFCEQLSQSLFAKGQIRLHPELTALAFWLRKSSIASLEERFRSLAKPGEYLVPRGLAFHIAPANVETLFVYSWILSLLVGNSNVVRLPSRKSAATALLFAILEELLQLKNFRKIADTTELLSYGHEEEITRAISEKADLRLIWGGDATIQTIRKFPLKITGKDLVFADRYAMAACRGEPDMDLFFRDLFWYDQNTCASPRTIFWLETCPKSCYQQIAQIAKSRNYQLPLSSRLKKITNLYRIVLDLPVKNIAEYGPLTVVELEQFHPQCRNFSGDGLLFHIEIQKVEQIADIIIQKDQTLVYNGLTTEELTHLATSLNGRGLDRIVPIGAALQFGEVWDGYDLLAELTKRMVIS